MGQQVTINLNPSSLADYLKFIQIKKLPRFKFVGRTAIIPDEYASLIGGGSIDAKSVRYDPSSFLFDYQRDITKIALKKQKFAIFARCGIGKDLMMKEFARTAADQIGRNKCVLIVCPLMVVKQAIKEAEKFYGNSFPIKQIKAKELNFWLKSGSEQVGITNFESLNDEIEPGRLGSLIIDESSVMKSFGGKWAATLIRLGKGIEWKLCLTGTPAPNDRIEYANHAVFLDRYPTINSFLSRFFVNRGQVSNRWELKPHALEPFYRSLSDWCIFLNNPSTYGWKDNCDTIPPINVHIESVPLTDEQLSLAQEMGGGLFGTNVGGIGSRSKMGQIAKGKHNGMEIVTHKPRYIREMTERWPGRSTLIWCLFNNEQERLAKEMPHALSMTGSTPDDKRIGMMDEFLSGEKKTLITKAEILGFGINAQICTRQIFSGLADSYEGYHQCVSRSNRIGSKEPLEVYIPITQIERPMVQNVLDKAKRVDEETAEQEKIFKQSMGELWELIHAA